MDVSCNTVVVIEAAAAALEGDIPEIFRVTLAVAGRPLMRMSPDTPTSLFLPAKMSINVVFPAPEGPMMANRIDRIDTSKEGDT